MPDLDDAIHKKGWTASPYEENAFHRQGPGNEHNMKILSPDGTSEAIIRPDGTLVTDRRNKGTFNYGQNFLTHALFDVAPYMLLGNSPNDPSTIGERGRIAVKGGWEKAKSDISEFFEK